MEKNNLEMLSDLAKQIIVVIGIVLEENENNYPEDVELEVEKPINTEKNYPDVKLNKQQVIFILNNIRTELESDLLNYSEDIKAIKDVLAKMESN